MHIAGRARRAMRSDRILQLLAQHRGLTPQLFQFRSIFPGQGAVAVGTECFRTLWLTHDALLSRTRNGEWILQSYRPLRLDAWSQKPTKSRVAGPAGNLCVESG